MKPLARKQIADLLAEANEQGFADEQKAMLSADLCRKNTRTRSQAGQTLTYIEGWHVIAEANRIFGFDGWASETVQLQCVSDKPCKLGRAPQKQGDRPQRDGFAVTYIGRVRVTVYAGSRVIVREGVGTGHGKDVDLGLAHESALKEAETDARKRALMTFGNQFGLALYDKAQRNVSDGSDDDAQTQQTPEAGAANVAAVAQPSVAAAPAPAPQSKPAAKTEKPAQTGARAPTTGKPRSGTAVEPAGPPVAKTLLDGIDHHAGLRSIVKRYVAARQAIEESHDLPAGETIETMNAAYQEWDAWWTALRPKMTVAEVGKVLKALETYTEKSQALDKVLDAIEAGADPQTGELAEDAA